MGKIIVHCTQWSLLTTDEDLKTHKVPQLSRVRLKRRRFGIPIWNHVDEFMLIKMKLLFYPILQDSAD